MGNDEPTTSLEGVKERNELNGVMKISFVVNVSRANRHKPQLGAYQIHGGFNCIEELDTPGTG